MKWGQEDFFLLIQTLPTFWATRILILRIFIFWIFWIPNFQISRSQISKNLPLGRAWALGRAGPLGGSSGGPGGPRVGRGVPRRVLGWAGGSLGGSSGGPGGPLGSAESWPTLEDFLLFYGILCFHAFWGSGGLENGPHISGSL